MQTRTITSLQHPLVKHLVKLRQNKDYRDDHHHVLVAGKTLIGELAAEGFAFKTLVIKEGTSIPQQIKTEEIVIASEALIDKISGLHSTEGIVAEISKPAPSAFNNLKYLLVCDAVQDPGNVGTLLRTATAFHWDAVYFVNESCDPYNDKALRAAKGATFRIPLREGNWSELREIIKNNQLSPLVADLEGLNIQEISKDKQKMALIMSNEAKGVSKEALDLCERITIPMSDKMESLNVAVAGGILMYALRNL